VDITILLMSLGAAPRVGSGQLDMNNKTGWFRVGVAALRVKQVCSADKERRGMSASVGVLRCHVGMAALRIEHVSVQHRLG